MMIPMLVCWTGLFCSIYLYVFVCAGVSFSNRELKCERISFLRNKRAGDQSQRLLTFPSRKRKKTNTGLLEGSGYFLLFSESHQDRWHFQLLATRLPPTIRYVGRLDEWMNELYNKRISRLTNVGCSTFAPQIASARARLANNCEISFLSKTTIKIELFFQYPRALY